ncbi:MAG: hypothetical protein ABJI60_13090 [Kangiellaceae bacterium]
MDKSEAEKLMEQIARNLHATFSLNEVLSELVPAENRKLFSHMMKELLKSNYELQYLIGRKCDELNPDYLGKEKFSLLMKKYETPEHPVSMPTDKDIQNANLQWEKIVKSRLRKNGT